MIARLAATALLLLPASLSLAAGRMAIVVGNDYAVGEQAPLRYAEDDAAKMASVLRDLGDVAPDDLFLLRGLGVSDVRAALERVRRKAAIRRQAHQRSLLIFYFSGHSDGLSLEMGTDRLGFDELRRLLSNSGVDVRVAIVDSCRSGALLAVKGTRPGPAFDVRLNDDGAAEGTVLLTSSAANEEALESKELHGSFFTHHLVSGLRGAADSSGDGRVTLAEAYQYAYHHTVSATSDTTVGAQHPAYDYRLTGVGEIVLTEPRRSSASLMLPLGFERALITRQDQVVAEVGEGAGRRLGLAPGRYHVAIWRQRKSLSTTVDLTAGEARDLAWAGLVPAAAPAFALAKGDDAKPQGEGELRAAIKLYESFQDDKAFAALRGLLARHPPANIASKAHLYLGLLLFNGMQSDQAREEFKQAMLADPAIEVPVDVSPKAQLAFGEARRQLSREVEALPVSAAQTPSPALDPGPNALDLQAEAPRPRSHWLSWTLGGVGIAAGAVAVYGAVEVLNYNSMVKNPHGVSAGNLNALNAPFWSAGWIAAAALGAAGLTSAVIVW